MNLFVHGVLVRKNRRALAFLNERDRRYKVMHMKDTMEHCVSNKLTFCTEAGAYESKNEIEKALRRQLRVYRCHLCDKYHFTRTMNTLELSDTRLTKEYKEKRGPKKQRLYIDFTDDYM